MYCTPLPYSTGISPSPNFDLTLLVRGTFYLLTRCLGVPLLTRTRTPTHHTARLTFSRASPQTMERTVGGDDVVNDVDAVDVGRWAC